MIRGIGIAQSDLPLELIARHGLAHRIVSRGGEPEYQFTWPDWNRVLPLWDNGQLRLVPWGVAREERSNLPIGGQVHLETVNAGNGRHPTGWSISPVR
jgi:hypothetical protein